MSQGKKREKNWSQGKIKRSPPKHRRKDALTPGERRRLLQLVACVVIFMFVFVGQTLPLARFSAFGGEVAALIHRNTDFKGALTKVGRSVSEGEPFVETFSILWTEVFGFEQGEGEVPLEPEFPAAEEAEALSPADPSSEPEESPLAEETAAPLEETADPMETVTPVMGVLASGFGFRTHPIDGEWKEHQGVDIQAAAGTPILAYAAGEVDYVGESEAYGLYLQLKHPGDVSTFYAHCQSVCVKPGQRVAAGEQIGEVGESGQTTGPHLHLEMKRGGKRVDPLAYIQTLPPG